MTINMNINTIIELKRCIEDKNLDKLMENIDVLEYFLIKYSYLKNPDFVKDWNEYLKSRKKKATARAMELSLEKLHKFDIQTAIKMLQNSISNGWQGLFEIKSNNSGNSQKSFAERDDENLGNLMKDIQGRLDARRSDQARFIPS